MEESLNLEELRRTVEEIRAVEHRAHKFAAALKGIDLDEGEKEEVQDRFDAVQRRVEAKLTGKSEESLEAVDLGLDFESDEDEL